MDEMGIPHRTLRGFLSGDENDEELYFHFSATLRVRGESVPFDELSRRLGVTPTQLQRTGQRRHSNNAPHREDVWHYQVPLYETEPLGKHLDALWEIVAPEVDYLKSLKQKLRLDVFCGYRSNCDVAGYEVPHESLKIFGALEIPFGVSVIITPN